MTYDNFKSHKKVGLHHPISLKNISLENHRGVKYMKGLCMTKYIRINVGFVRGIAPKTAYYL